MERRNTRRLARYCVFLSIAYFVGLGGFVYYSVLHALFSSLSASVGMIGPRYLMGAIGLYYLTGFVLGIVFLGFDVRARDIRDGIVEVLDARPLSNLELVAGRFVALFLSAWIPIVVLVLLIQSLGFLLPLLGSPVGRTAEPLSLANFVFFMAVPAITFAIGLVFLITLLVRHRLIAALVTIAAIVGVYWGLFAVPGPIATYFDYLGVAQQAFPSDIVPTMAVPGGFLQRFGVLLLGLGLVGLAAAIHPRLDGQFRLRPALGSAGLAVAGLAAVAFVAELRMSEVDALDRWRAVHEARAGEPAADILSIDASVRIDPGARLDARLAMEIQAPPDASLRRVLLTLNPGFEVGTVSAGGQTLEAGHADGLLDIELARPLAPGERATLNLSYGGRPNTLFGYLDSALVPEKMTLNEAQVVLLGYERGIFDRRYAALTPGIRWLPAAGVDVGRDDPRERRKDFYAIALEVELPPDWLAAGPGLRETLGSTSESARFRFAPATDVPEVALMAGKLASFATEIRGIRFEVLVHPEHDENFEVLAHTRGEVEDWIEERLEVAERAGLDYPFGAFTVVEVPNTLRAFEGGWRLNTALAPPSMMLLRETSFPTARFDFDVIAAFGNRNDDQIGGQAAVDRNRLVNFFANDFSGGNVFAGAARSFFAHRTSAHGDEAIALDFVLEELSTLLVSGRRSYFSAHLFTNINQAVTSIVSTLQGQAIGTITDAVLTTRTSRIDVWNAVLDVSLSGLDPWADPQRTIDILTLKGGQMASAIRDSLGADAVSRLLANLLRRHAGETFSLEELVLAGDGITQDLGPLFDDWITSTGLPGFVVRGVEQYRLPDDDNGNARYQLRVGLSNDEPVVGFARISWLVPASTPGPGAGVVVVFSNDPAANVAAGQAALTLSEPIRIEGHSAIEFGVVLSSPVTAVRVHPYLSLNRDVFLADQLSVTSIPTRDVEPVAGVGEIPFDFDEGEEIVADDLDPGFQIVTGDPSDSIRLTGRGTIAGDLDQGLPVSAAASPSRWSRRAIQSAWGRYRHTFAYIRAGDGANRAVLPAAIPNAGVWELEIHIPQFLMDSRGTWNLEIVTDDGREAVGYDAAVSNVGWNLVGEFELPAGEVRVEISDRTDGAIVIADALRWSPARAGLRRGQ
jgi:hypothetical protein